MRNGSLARPGAAVRIGTGRGLRAFILVSLEISIWVGFLGLTYLIQNYFVVSSTHSLHR